MDRKLVRSRIIENWESQDEPEHLRTIRDRIFHSELNSISLLKLYVKFLYQNKITATDSLEERELLLSGLIIKHQGTLSIHNRIYELIFDESWLERTIGNQLFKFTI